MGLETVHPEILEPAEQANDTPHQFAAAAADRLHENDIRPYACLHSRSSRRLCRQSRRLLEWAARSLEFAFECGASAAAALIPTRAGNGAMEDADGSGENFSPPIAWPRWRLRRNVRDRFETRSRVCRSLGSVNAHREMCVLVMSDSIERLQADEPAPARFRLRISLSTQCGGLRLNRTSTTSRSSGSGFAGSLLAMIARQTRTLGCSNREVARILVSSLASHRHHCPICFSMNSTVHYDLPSVRPLDEVGELAERSYPEGCGVA
jgi:hypothetical protein